MEVILYGPKARADDVGAFMEACGYYLQEPSGCDRNVPYYNPQCLASLEGDLPMTFDVQGRLSYGVDDFTRETDPLLTNFETTEEFEETPTPEVLCTPLHR